MIVFSILLEGVHWAMLELRMPLERWCEGHTFEYHFKASSGTLYCFAFSSRSLTSLGKTVSKSLSLLDEDIVLGSGSSPSVVCRDF